MDFHMITTAQSDSFVEFVNKRLDKRFKIPDLTILNSTDWNLYNEDLKKIILCSTSKKYIGYVNKYNRWNLLNHANDIYPPIEPNYSKFINDIRKFHNWLEREIFKPNKMLLDCNKTLCVKLRVGFSLLDKIEMPHVLRLKFQEHLLDCLYERKRIFEEYVRKELNKLPF